MESISTAAKLGLRERKKQQTREAIERVALQLFAEQGYDETTLAGIAEAADIAPRTIFAYFESKEDILFCEEPTMIGRVKAALAQRPPGTTTVDALQDFLASVPAPDEQALLRKRILAANPALKMKMRAHIAGLESVLAESIAKDLGAGPDDIRPTLAAASMTAAFTAVRNRLEAGGAEPSDQQVREILDQVLEFLRGGLAALQNG